MASHLEVLTSIFPGKIFLDVEDIAKCLGQSKGHIYNLSSTKRLPFQLEWGLGDKIQVSIVEMANYLDSRLENKVVEKIEPKLDSPVVVVKKVGRPRRSMTKIHMAFQAQLQCAIIKEEVRYIFEYCRGEINSFEFDTSENIECVDKVAAMKNQAGLLIKEASHYMEHSFLNMKIAKPEVKTSIGNKLKV